MVVAPSTFLRILDDASRAFTFPCLDNGYVYLAASRLSLFRSPQDWALVIEIFGYSPRSGIPDTSIFTFASRLHDRDPSSRFANRDAYEQYLRNNPHNEFRSIGPIEEGPWMDDEAPEMVALAGEVRVRGSLIPLPVITAYARHGIELQEERPAIFEWCRYLAAEHRELVLATQEEQRVSVLPEMTRILQLEEWHHPDIVGAQMPSTSQTFQQLADVLASGDPSRYCPTEEPNTHWKNWPEGGTL